MTRPVSLPAWQVHAKRPRCPLPYPLTVWARSPYLQQPHSSSSPMAPFSSSPPVDLNATLSSALPLLLADLAIRCAMSSPRWRGESSRQGSRASRPMARPAVCPRRRILVEDETGLPLIQCLECGQARVIELRAWTEENYGRVFFKCPANMQGVRYVCA